ncbi:hypothetical protein [Actinophytocola xinjiangensis]|uniref:hypothetical protein n=1 Tax=Actinophytocola xinjiangensis TaxID=485602 RepID=UPI0012B7D736|nr:hypothetical protein [Actinophytocola xinjiangensis]
MPKLDRETIRRWLEDHDWSVKRLANECSVLSGEEFPEGTMRNVINGIDPVRPGRIRLIARVTAKYGDGLSYATLLAKNQ